MVDSLYFDNERNVRHVRNVMTIMVGPHGTKIYTGTYVAFPSSFDKYFPPELVILDTIKIKEKVCIIEDFLNFFIMQKNVMSQYI